MARKFNQGKQSELLYNEELYNMYQLIKHLAENPYAETDENGNQLIAPIAETDGAVWLDRFTGGDIKYFANGKWNLAFDNYFKMIKDILSSNQPDTGVDGQLWINPKSGQMFYWDGTGMWKPVIATSASTDSSLSAFSDFLLISPLTLQGNVTVDYPIWTTGEEPHADYATSDTSDAANILRESYWKDDIVWYQSRYYQCIETHVPTDSITPIDTTKWKTYDNISLMSQFLLPNTAMDKFFINGKFTDDYTVKTNVCIEYPLDKLQGASASGVHVNPTRLINIKKTLFLIDPLNPVIEYNETNTEFYAFSNGIGKLLNKTNDSNTDYTSTGIGIRLPQKITSVYDFILAVNYQFANSRHSGNLYKGSIALDGTGDHGIYIGNIADPICVFVQGMYLDENAAQYPAWIPGNSYSIGDKVSHDFNYYSCSTSHISGMAFDDIELSDWEYVNAQINYNYNPSTGYLTMPLQKELDVAVISFTRVVRGTIQVDSSTNKGFIQLNASDPGFTPFKHPLVFICGESLSTPVTLADYTFDDTLQRFWIDNAQAGMAYAVVESDNSSEAHPDYNMFVKSDIVPTPSAGQPTSIPCDFTIITEDINPVIFVDGIIVSQKDITRNSDGSYSMYGLEPGQDYTLLRDPEGRVLFDDMASFITLPIKDASGNNVTVDTALVYIEDSLICDSAAVYTSALPAAGGNGELKLLLNNGFEQWYKYNSSNLRWEAVTDTTAIAKYQETAADTGYSVSKKAISILNDFCEGTQKTCTYFGYVYANTVEEALHQGTMFISQDQTVCKVGFKDLYPKDVNALSVWIDGFRQYYITENSDGRTFELPESTGNPSGDNLLYVIEKPEGSEIKSCERELVNYKDSSGNIVGKISGTVNTFQTKMPLFPGNLRVFIGGIRQPATAYEIIDAYTIMIKDPIKGGMNQEELDQYTINKNNTPTICTPVEDTILLEVRQDYSLRECTVEAKQGQRVFTVSNDNIPDTLLESRDFVMIYINGLAYGLGYVIDKNNGSIELTNRDVTDYLSTDNMAAFFSSNPIAYQNWKNKTGNSYYQPKLIKDLVTFEWR